MNYLPFSHLQAFGKRKKQQKNKEKDTNDFRIFNEIV
jgi:hypothetical protein